MTQTGERRLPGRILSRPAAAVHPFVSRPTPP